MALAVVTFVAALWAVRGELGTAWDEPEYLTFQYALRSWIGQVFGTPQERSRALTTEGLNRGWLFCHGYPYHHPPVSELLCMVTGASTEWLLGPLRANRLATVLVFATAAGVLERLVRTRWGTTAAVAAVGALVFNPRLFADAQLVTTDSDVGAFWFLAAVAFLKSCEGRCPPWAFGVLAGLAFMSKVTGVLVLPAMGLWFLLYRPPRGWRTIAWSVPLVPATVLALNPAWWRAPIASLVLWIHAYTAYPQKVPVYYLGRVYDSVHAYLPWHNTAVLTGVMVPLGLLVLGAVGLLFAGWDALKKRETARSGDGPYVLPDRAIAGCAAINFLMLMVLRTFAFMPAHDGLRQLAAAFYFFALLAGFGAWVLVRSAHGGSRRLAQIVVVALVASAGFETVRIHPFELSYYNMLIGGPRGAKVAGMESTYYWDAATAPVLDWMNAHLPRGATVLIFPPPNVRTFEWEQQSGRLRKDLVFLNLDPPNFAERLGRMYGPGPCYLIFQMRQGLYAPRKPGENDPFVRLAEAPALFEQAPERVDGVRLLAIFDSAQFRAVMNAGAAPPAPKRP